jgi:hypothetical protein
MDIFLILFVILSVVFQTCIALVDAFFNKMIRTNIENWENLDEFKWITIFLLGGFTFLPPAIIILISPFYGILYGICFCFVPWDIFFGKIVYGKWFADTPSLKIGSKWYKMKLWKAIVLRILIGIGLIVLLKFL